jgi:hypothetical protein
MTAGDKTGETGTQNGDRAQPGHAERLARFAERLQSMRITSTGAAIVTFTGTLYNVKESTHDPKIDKLKWKQLLIRMSAASTECKITQACYADTPAAEKGSSHDAFSVGGHVTPNASGIFEPKGTCYLMPLCFWHNSTGRDGKAFSHKNTCMLELSGYMQAEPFETFAARLDGAAPAAIVYVGEDGLESRPLANPERETAKALGLARVADDRLPESFVILHRTQEDGETFYRIADSRTAG